MANNAVIKGTKVIVGDTVQVMYRIIEKDKASGKTKKEVKEEVRERIQPFEGVVTKIKGVAENQSFTVIKTGADAVEIERIFPVVSPWIDKIIVKKSIFDKKKVPVKAVKKAKTKSEKSVK